MKSRRWHVAEESNRHWWLLILRGVCAILFGVLAFVWPGITLEALVLLFGAYALVNGVLSILIAARAPEKTPGRALTAALGVLGITAAAVTLFYPAITALSLVIVIASWAIVTGVFEIVAAVQLRTIMRGSWALVVSGLLSVVFGVLLLAMPAAGALSLVWLIGAWAIMFGAFLIAAAVQLKKAHIVIAEPAHAL